MSDQHLFEPPYDTSESALDRPVFYYPPKPSPAAAEVVADGRKERSGRIRQIHRVLGGVAAVGAAVSAFLPSDAPNLEQNRLLSSGTEIVQPAGTVYYEGLKQAEQFFDQGTLDRTRAAVDAYLAGDSSALDEQQAELGYRANWVTSENQEAIETATSKEELEEAFHNALRGLPVTLQIADTSQALAKLDQGYEHMLAHDLGQDKKLVLSVVDTLNLFDFDHLKKELGPLNIVIVGEMVDLRDRGAVVEGYYNPATDAADADQIVVAEVHADEQGLFPHELIHDKDMHANKVLRAKIGQLNLSGYNYSHTNKATEVDGWNTVSRGYGNTDSGEDAATIGENILRESPKILFENSPLGEKQMALLLTFEQEEPGFSAALLSRTPPQEEPSQLWRIAQETWSKVVENKQRIAGVSTLVLASVLGVEAIRLIRRRKHAKKN